MKIGTKSNVTLGRRHNKVELAKERKHRYFQQSCRSWTSKVERERDTERGREVERHKRPHERHEQANRWDRVIKLGIRGH
jgi:hypothetical protein